MEINCDHELVIILISCLWDLIIWLVWFAQAYKTNLTVLLLLCVFAVGYGEPKVASDSQAQSGTFCG